MNIQLMAVFTIVWYFYSGVTHDDGYNGTV